MGKVSNFSQWTFDSLANYKLEWYAQIFWHLQLALQKLSLISHQSVGLLSFQWQCINFEQIVWKEGYGMYNKPQVVFLSFPCNHLKRERERKEHPKQPSFPVISSVTSYNQWSSWREIEPLWLPCRAYNQRECVSWWAWYSTYPDDSPWAN